jgi:histidinol-phosphate aminotransferase
MMIDKLLELARKEIQTLAPYSSARREYAKPGIYLNANESPYTKAGSINRYPHPQPQDLRELLSKLYQVKSQQILMTRGADEGIDLWIRTFCAAGKDAIMVCPPTYDMYAICAKIQHAGIISVPLLQECFALDLDHMLKAWTPQCKLIFLCSPNNPTGNMFSPESILYLCEHLKDKALIVVDEAYVEFSKTPSMSQYLDKYDNLVILRTLSKAYGMAGARCGVVLAHEKLIALLEKVISPYPLASPVIDVILRELQEDNVQQITQQISTIKSERENLIAFLEKQSFVEKIWPSEANFILLKVKNATTLIDHCAQHDIIVRDRSSMLGLSNCVRISIGLPEENVQLQQILSQL